MDWPESLIRELADRRCVVFLGAGASAGCESRANPGAHPPVWRDLLEEMCQRLPERENEAALGLIGEARFLDAAEVIRDGFPAADFAGFIRQKFVQPNFSESQLHKCVLGIDPKIVLTTNYDRVYETYCTNGDATDGYNVAKYYDDHLVSDLRSPVRSIVKVHGCVSDCSKIVLSRSDYFNHRRTYANFYKLLDALFITSTVLFVGYSLSDPDIQLVLENANIAAPTSHPHYAVIESGQQEALQRSWSKSYNIHFIEFPRGDFDELERGMNELVASVEAMRATGTLG